MTSLSRLSGRILKAERIKIDEFNRVTIEVPALEEPITIEDTEDDAEAKAMSAAARIISTAEMQANEIKNRARMDALAIQSKIEAETKAEAERLLRETEENAYNAGMSKAKSEGDMIIAEAKEILTDAKNQRQFLQESLEPDIVKLIIDISDKLIGNAKNLNPKTITYLVKQGFGTGQISGDIKVMVSPDDFEMVVKSKDELLAFTDGAANLEIVKDLSLNPLDCVIETSMGHIDCSLESQYIALKQNLTYILQQSPLL